MLILRCLIMFSFRNFTLGIQMELQLAQMLKDKELFSVYRLLFKGEQLRYNLMFTLNYTRLGESHLMMIVLCFVYACKKVTDVICVVLCCVAGSETRTIH